MYVTLRLSFHVLRQGQPIGAEFDSVASVLGAAGGPRGDLFIACSFLSWPARQSDRRSSFTRSGESGVEASDATSVPRLTLETNIRNLRITYRS